MEFTFGLAETDEDREAVYRFRYEVYVEEMGRYHGVADHEARTFREPEDEHSRVFRALHDGTVVATGRYTWGGDRFSERQIDQYRLQPFLDELPPEMLCVGERLMIDPAFRGTTLMRQMMDALRDSADDLPIEIVFGACEPHLLPLYIAEGQRPYADRNINSSEAGYLIPLITFQNGIEAISGDGPVPECLRPVADGSGAILSDSLAEPDEYLGEITSVLHAVDEQEIAALSGLSEADIERCLSRSNIISCTGGDQVLKKGGTARNLFMVLDGTLEVRDGDRLIGVLTAGDVFGEMAFLLERPRSFDVYAATDDTRVLSLSEGELRRLIANEPAVAATLLLNISKMLCLRLIKAN